MDKMRLTILAAVLLAVQGHKKVEILDIQEFTSTPWTWECHAGACSKFEVAANASKRANSLDVCRLICTDGILWPQPKEIRELSSTLIPVNINSISIHCEQEPGKKEAPTEATVSLVRDAGKLFIDNLKKLSGNKNVVSGRTLEVNVVLRNQSINKLTLNTNESYDLVVENTPDGRINATICADNFFGGRHGLETLSQLVVYDPVSKALLMPSAVAISDLPSYSYRGLLVDTSRNFIPVENIKNIINAMSWTKLNTFHWHITDSQSFPMESESFPQMSKLGAYSPDKVYKKEEIIDIVKYATVRGIRVLPEFDAPAHVGEGWQWAGDALVCFKATPWNLFCEEPPCGQLNPLSEKVYEIIDGIYNDMSKYFDSDIFHMGGDEIKFTCWNSSDIVVNGMKEKGLGREKSDFLELWGIFQERARKLVHKHMPDVPIILWTSSITEPDIVEKYLDNSKYIIQVWTKGNDSVITRLLEKGYKLIMSNYDALYFDCGFGSWVGEGNNWCSPFISWKKVYMNKPKEFQAIKGNETLASHILGSEATIWTEQTDKSNIETRLWPRASALGEQLWNPNIPSWREAEGRFMYHAGRTAQRGVSVDGEQPEWCLQNEKQCLI